MWGISKSQRRHLPLHCQGPSFAAEARFLSRDARVKRLKLAPLSEQAHLLGTGELLLTIGRAGQRSRELLTTCGRSWSRAARWVALRWQARRVKLLLSVDEHGSSITTSPSWECLCVRLHCSVDIEATESSITFPSRGVCTITRLAFALYCRARAIQDREADRYRAACSRSRCNFVSVLT